MANPLKALLNFPLPTLRGIESSLPVSLPRLTVPLSKIMSQVPEPPLFGGAGGTGSQAFIRSVAPMQSFLPAAANVPYTSPTSKVDFFFG